MNILIFVLRLIGSFYMSFTDFILPNEGCFGDCLCVCCGGYEVGRRGSVPKYKCPKSYLGPSVSLCTIFLDCISAYFEKRQKFTPGDIPDNSPGQWQGSPTSPLLLLLLPKTQQCPPYSQITGAPHTTLHASIVPCFGSSGVVCTWVLYVVWFQVCIARSSGACAVLP